MSPNSRPNKRIRRSSSTREYLGEDNHSDWLRLAPGHDYDGGDESDDDKYELEDSIDDRITKTMMSLELNTPRISYNKMELVQDVCTLKSLLLKTGHIMDHKAKFQFLKEEIFENLPSEGFGPLSRLKYKFWAGIYKGLARQNRWEELRLLNLTGASFGCDQLFVIEENDNEVLLSRIANELSFEFYESLLQSNHSRNVIRSNITEAVHFFALMGHQENFGNDGLKLFKKLLDCFPEALFQKPDYIFMNVDQSIEEALNTSRYAFVFYA